MSQNTFNIPFNNYTLTAKIKMPMLNICNISVQIIHATVSSKPSYLCNGYFEYKDEKGSNFLILALLSSP